MTQPQYSPKLRVINEAAEHIGANAVDAASSAQSGAAQILFQRYDQAVREVLELRDWHCAVKRFRLTPSPDDGLHPGYIGHRLPADFICLPRQGGYRDHYIEAGFIYARSALDILRYVSFDTESLWTPNLIRLIGLNLARKCIYTRKESAQASELLEQKYNLHLRQVNALEGANTAEHVTGLTEFYNAS